MDLIGFSKIAPYAVRNYVASAIAEALKPQWEENVEKVWKENAEVKVALDQEVDALAKQSSLSFYVQGVKQQGVVSALSKQVTYVALTAFGALAFVGGFLYPNKPKAGLAALGGAAFMLGGSTLLYQTNKGYLDAGIKTSIAAAVDKHTGDHLSAEDRFQLTEKLFRERKF